MMPMMLRQFKLVRAIASGGMGTVYRAIDTSLNREVAVKMILSSALASEEDIARFRTEAEECCSVDLH